MNKLSLKVENVFKNEKVKTYFNAFMMMALFAMIIQTFGVFFAGHAFAASTTSSGAGATLWSGVTAFFSGGFVKVIVLGVIFFGIFEVATGKHVLLGLLVIVIGALMFYLPTLVNDLPSVFGAVI